jgi:exosortase/archaeosortase family protein
VPAVRQKFHLAPCPDFRDHLSVSGWTDALLSTFGISAIVWIACFSGVMLILRERTGIVRPPDLVLGLALLLLITLPIGHLSWLAITILCLYVLLSTDPSSSRERGALILLATTVPMLCSRLLFRYFANFILDIDASLIGLLLGSAHTGNIVRFADQSGSLVIYPGCSSLANVSVVFVTWVTVSQWLSHRWSLKDLFWCFLAAVSVIAINVIRISLMGLSEMHYQMIHNPWGETIANLLIVSLTVGLCLLGVKRELFHRV